MLDPINFQKVKVCINITTHNYWMVYDFQLSLIIITRVCGYGHRTFVVVCHAMV